MPECNTFPICFTFDTEGKRHLAQAGQTRQHCRQKRACASSVKKGHPS